MKKVSTLITEVFDVRSNPAAMQDVIYSVIPDMLDGSYDVVDPNNPVALAIESACYLAATGISQNEILSRNEYSILAQDFSNLYHHMSDVDYLDRFAIPSSADFTLILSLDEIILRAVKVDDGVSVITIPENTRISLDGISFTLYYPIEIRVLSHGGIQVVYNTDNLNPIKTLASNVVDWEIVSYRSVANLSSGKMLKINIPADQFRIDTFKDQLNPSTGFNKSYTYDNSFYYCRVWTSSNDGEWVEIKTTHSDQVYDTSVTTALLKVLDGELNVSIPQIYFSNGISGQNIRVDIYTTQGYINTSFESYSPDAYVTEYIDYKKHQSPTNEPIRTFSNLTLFSTSKVDGGSEGLTFEQLRERVTYNSLGKIDFPITDAQIKFKLERLGYSILKDTDTLTNRSYLATRTLPKPTDLEFNTEIGSTIKTLNTTFNELVTHSNVRDNGKRITIESDSLFELNDGILSIVSDSDSVYLNQLNEESLTTAYNTSSYFNTLFHYVLDSTDDVFSSRPFFLDAPKVKSKTFIAENESTQLEISTFRYAIEIIPQGYKLIVISRGSDVTNALSDDQMHVLLVFTPPGEYDRAVLKGNITGRTASGDFMIEFIIGSNFDIDVRNRLFVNTFKMFDTSERNVPMFLDTKFDIIYAVTDYLVEGIKKVHIDDLVPPFIIEDTFYSIIQEQLNINIGVELEGLWSRSKTIAGSNDYQRYDSDVFLTHRDVYEKDPLTGLDLLTLDADSGKILRNKIHSEGDFVLVNGEKVIDKAKGDVIVGSDLLPLISSGRQTNRQIDLFLLEGIFKISTDINIQNYYKETVSKIVDWISNDISEVESKLHENTDLYFYPKNNMGRVDVLVGSDTPSTLNAEQSFTVKFYLTELGYKNDELKLTLQRIAKDIITLQLDKKTISVNNMAHQIKSVTTEEVLSVVVSGLGGSNNYELVTIKDEDAAMTIKKNVLVLPDNTITIEDSIVFEWVQHTGDV